MGNLKNRTNFIIVVSILVVVLAISFSKYSKLLTDKFPSFSGGSGSLQCKHGFTKDGRACLTEREVLDGLKSMMNNDEEEEAGPTIASPDEPEERKTRKAKKGDVKVAKNANEKGKPREAEKKCLDRYPKECPNWKR